MPRNLVDLAFLLVLAGLLGLVTCVVPDQADAADPRPNRAGDVPLLGCRQVVSSKPEGPGHCLPAYEAWVCDDGTFRAIGRRRADHHGACLVEELTLPPTHPRNPVTEGEVGA